MTEDPILVNRVIDLMTKVKKWKWRNTSALAKELKVDQQYLLEVLIDETERPGRRVAYHPLPGRKKMDILWGLATEDTQLQHAPPLIREDQPETFTRKVADLVPYVFISHNHRDFKRIAEIMQLITNKGINSWLFELHIEHESLIIPAVQEALLNAAGFLVYVSRYSLGSAWVQKELEFLTYTGDQQILIVIDGTDRELIRLIDNGSARSGRNSELGIYIEQTLSSLAKDEKQQYQRIAGLFLQQIVELMQNKGRVCCYPDNDCATDTDIQPAGTIRSWLDSMVG